MADLTTDRQIADILGTFGEPVAGNIWRVQGTAVIYHKALERIATQAKITFDLPIIIRAERDECVMQVAGRRGDHMEWSLGEALVGVNYRVSGKQAAYVYAMAEKRAKDRVILKLIGLHGMVYSEEEADEFKRGERESVDAGNDDAEPDSKALFINGAQAYIRQSTDKAALAAWWRSDAQAQQRRAFDLSKDQTAILVRLITERGEALDAATGAGEAA